VELSVRIDTPAGPLRLGTTTALTMLRLTTSGDAVIPRDGAVIVARGKAGRLLRAAWTRAQAENKQALLRMDSTAVQAWGGGPVLVHEGRLVRPTVTSTFSAGRHPRTVVGRTRSGDVLLVTIDGRQPGHSVGASLSEAAELMLRLGAVEAINLDGGGSTTFVLRGQVVNRPSDLAVMRRGTAVVALTAGPHDRILGNVERPVAEALAIVPTQAAPRTQAAGSAITSVTSRLTPPHIIRTVSPTHTDPASSPDSALPALLVAAPAPRKDPAWPFAVAGILPGLVLVLHATRRRRTSDRR
jgi:hypothetical protein